MRYSKECVKNNCVCFNEIVINDNENEAENEKKQKMSQLDDSYV